MGALLDGLPRRHAVGPFHIVGNQLRQPVFAETGAPTAPSNILDRVNATVVGVDSGDPTDMIPEVLSTFPSPSLRRQLSSV